jgi:ssDNA-binding Zn-finger/Zn-ribbon topoisomerase 1
MENTEIEKVKLSGYLNEFRQALEEEIDEIKKSGQSSLLLTGGRRIESSGPDFWYRFRIEYLPNLPSDTPCKLTVGKDSFDVTVISFTENAIIIASKVELPGVLASAKLDNSTTALMERLIARIEANAEKVNPAGTRMLGKTELKTKGSFKRISNDSNLYFEGKKTDNQIKAIKSAITNDITYIWGPPGTGKTTVISHIIQEMLHRERSVLLVSHTNTAVDGAIQKTDEEYTKALGEPSSKVPYPILRLGSQTEKRLNERVLIKSHIDVLGKEIYAKKDVLEKEKNELHTKLREIISQISKVKWVQENNLSQAETLLNEIDVLKYELNWLTHERDEIVKELEVAKTSSYSHQEFDELQKFMTRKEREVKDLHDQIEKTKSDLTFAANEMRFTKDGLVKHTKYKELREKEARQLSIHAQNEQIARIKDQISDLKKREQIMLAELESYEKKIDEYNQKGTIAKFLAGKALYNQASLNSDAIKENLSATKSLLEAKMLTLKSFENQLIESLSIQEQINAFAIHDKEEDLQNRYKQMFEKAASLSAQLPIRKSKYEQCASELSKLRIMFEQSKKLHDELLDIEKRLVETDAVFRQKQNLIYDKKNQCEKVLEADLVCCSCFGEFLHVTDISATYDELVILLQRIKPEADGVDIAGLESEKQEIDQKITDILKVLSELDQKLNELEKQAIMQAKVIGTTLVKSYLSDILQERNFDTVILDEASMAPIPSLWCASYLAEKNIVIVGDFKQLPPIVMAETPMAQNWLGKDIFKQSGMQDRLGVGKKPPENFITLDEQFRMEKEIADIANMYYKEQETMLKSNDNDEKRIEARKEFYQWYAGEQKKHCIHLIDTKNLHAWVTGVPQGKNHSRLNCFSSALCVDLAFRLLEKRLKEYQKTEKKEKAEKPYVLIVAPYKPHIHRIKKLIDLEYELRGIKESEDINYIQAGTIHSFQGSEADIVIFDLVVDEPHWKANLFLQDEVVNDDLKRMFNVAITRAKFKLFVVGNFSYCQKHAKDNALGKLLYCLINENRFDIEDAKKLFPKLTYAPPEVYVGNAWQDYQHIICKENSFFDYFISDIQMCRHQLIIYSPFITKDRLSSLIPSFADAINRGCSIIIVTKALSDRTKTEFEHYKKCEEELRKIGINIIHKKGMHEKLIYVDDKAVWMGSLNALSFSGFTGEIMHRHCDEKLFTEYSKLLDIEHMIETVKNPIEQKCPICGNEMIAAESDSGGFYWTCINKDYTRQPTQQYPTNGVLLCKCGSPYKFAMRNQPRWVCVADTSHYQFMRESDLKLEKMKALIPVDKQKVVLKYFADKRTAKENEKQKSELQAKKLNTQKKFSSIGQQISLSS